MKKLISAIIISLVITGSLLINAFATESKITSKDAEKLVNDIGKQVLDIVKNKSLPEQKMRQEIINVLDKSLNSAWIARFVLGKSYRTATDKQREEFQNLYREFMINTYGPKFKNYNGNRFEVLEVEDAGKFYLVKCEFLQKDSNTSTKIDFRVRNDDGKLLIIDLIAEGVSLIETHRSEFNSAISINGLDKFLEDLKIKVDALKKNS